MRIKVKKYKDVSPVDFLVLRERLGFGRYRKTSKRDKEKRKILLDLALKKMEEKEKDDFIILGYRRRKIKCTLYFFLTANLFRAFM
ncbi:MAG: hypothetical protein L0958_05490 [Candidatus Mariimomonas ferrooxydans]